MKTLKKNWSKFVGGLVLASAAVCAVYACVSAWGQAAPGLNIAVVSNAIVSLTVTNGTSNGLYQLYFTESLPASNSDWNLFTNGSTGQTNFFADMGDLDQGFFKAVNNTNFLPPSITVIIQSPLNGSVIQ